MRLLVTWESLSHRGPNAEVDVDEEYVTYLVKLITMMDQYGIKVIICAHQDVWSRFSGGSGAPGWTFAKAGLDIEAFKATGAAFVHNLFGEEEQNASSAGDWESSRKPEPVGAFVWPSGYQKAAAATMATLFWAGGTFASQMNLPHYQREKQEMINIQEYLQSSFIESFGLLVDRLSHLDALLGFDLINEPHRGYVGLSDWHSWCYETDLHIGHFPSPIQSFALASGYKQEVPFYVKSWPFPTRRTHYSTIDPLGKSAWLPDAGMSQCVWRAHGVWQWDSDKNQPIVLADDYFLRDPRPGKNKARIEWYRDFYAPFVVRLIARLRRKNRHLLCLVEPIPNEFMPPWSHVDTVNKLDDAERFQLMKASYEQKYATKTFIDTSRPLGFVYSPHFYDLNVLFGKVHGAMSVNVQGLSRGLFLPMALYFGKEGLKKNYAKQIATLVENAKTSLGAVPIIIGEVGIPFDINGGRALRTGDYAKHIELYDALIEAMEKSQVAYTLWNYNPDNTVAFGDGWNKEDFSFLCNEPSASDLHNDIAPRDKENLPTAPAKDRNWSIESLHRGGRALTAIIRPYAVKVAGFPLTTTWDREQRIFEFKYTNTPLEFKLAAMDSENKNSLHIGTISDTDALRAESLKAQEANTTLVYVPQYHFKGFKVRVQISDGTYDLHLGNQTLSVKHSITTPGYVHTIRIAAQDTVEESEIEPGDREILARRERNRKLRHGRIPLSAQDVCAILGVLVALVVALIVAEVGSTIIKARASAHDSIDYRDYVAAVVSKHTRRSKPL